MWHPQMSSTGSGERGSGKGDILGRLGNGIGVAVGNISAIDIYTSRKNERRAELKHLFIFEWDEIDGYAVEWLMKAANYLKALNTVHSNKMK